MPRLVRSVLILLLVLLPLRGWTQASMSADACAVAGALQPHGVDADACDAAAMSASDVAHHGHATTDGAAHDHAHCVICHLAIGQPPTFDLSQAKLAPAPCPQTAEIPWCSADPRALQRPPIA